MKKLCVTLLFILTLSLTATVTVSITDVSGDAAVHQVASSGTARWIQFIAADTNSTTTCTTTSMAGCPRIGDASISTSRGLALLPGAGMFLPQEENNQSGNYQLTDVYYLVQTGDKIQILLGK